MTMDFGYVIVRKFGSPKDFGPRDCGEPSGSKQDDDNLRIVVVTPQGENWTHRNFGFDAKDTLPESSVTASLGSKSPLAENKPSGEVLCQKVRHYH